MIKFFVIIVLCLVTVINCNVYSCDIKGIKSKKAGWMVGNWGVRVVIPTGNNELVENFSVIKLADQLSDLKSVKWIMINLSAPSWGSYYAGPNPILSYEIDQSMVPKRDLFSELAKTLKIKGYKIIVYFASQGPSLNFLDGDRKKKLKKNNRDYYLKVKDIENKWIEYLIKKRFSSSDRIAIDIIEYYSKRYKDTIDGWWFDHGKFGDFKMYSKAALSGNINSIISWNEKHNKIIHLENDGTTNFVWLLTKQHQNIDFTDGHVTPTIKQKPWWEGNEKTINQIEKCANIDGAVAHFFAPLQDTWRDGKNMFPEDKAIDWTLRIINASGAITWAVPLENPEFHVSKISEKQYEILKKIDIMVQNEKTK